MPWFDMWGWASLTEIPGRYTDTPIPENIPQGYAANWTGHAWVVIPYIEPTTVIQPVERKITKRSFWNRFPQYNEIAMRAVMLSGTPVLFAASLERLKARVDSSPFVDLNLQETIDGVLWLTTVNVPEYVDLSGTLLPVRLTQEQANAILNDPISDEEAWEVNSWQSGNI